MTDLEAFRPPLMLEMWTFFHFDPTIVIDITSSESLKIKSIEAYGSQFTPSNDGPVTFLSKPEFIQQVMERDGAMGMKIGVRYGEGFIHRGPIGITNPLKNLQLGAWR